MKPFTGNRWYGLAAAGALALTVASASASADDFARNLGPVGPNEPILTSVGSKRVIAFYEANGGGCGMNIVVWDRADQSGSSAARVRVMLNPREVVHIESADAKSLNLRVRRVRRGVDDRRHQQNDRSGGRPISPCSQSEFEHEAHLEKAPSGLRPGGAF